MERETNIFGAAIVSCFSAESRRGSYLLLRIDGLCDPIGGDKAKEQLNHESRDQEGKRRRVES